MPSTNMSACCHRSSRDWQPDMQVIRQQVLHTYFGSENKEQQQSVPGQQCGRESWVEEGLRERKRPLGPLEFVTHVIASNM